MNFNLEKYYQISAVFIKNIPDTTNDSRAVQVFTLPNFCFCITCEKQQFLSGSAETHVW